MGTQCISPLHLVDKKTKKVNVVPCGKCYPCLLRKRHEWFFRLNCEIDTSRGPCRFVTLTYSDDNLPISDSGIAVVSKRDCQLFLKRLRKNCDRRFGGSDIRYFLISEYGPTTLRPHYHLALFNLPYKDKRGLVPDIDRIIKESWNLGEVTSAPLEPGRVGYLAGYFFNTAPQGVPAEFPSVSSHELKACYWSELVREIQAGRTFQSPNEPSRMALAWWLESEVAPVFYTAIVQPDLFESIGRSRLRELSIEIATRDPFSPGYFQYFGKAATGESQSLLRWSSYGKRRKIKKESKTS